MTALDGYSGCTRGAPVVIFKRVHGDLVLKRETFTDDEGFYRVQINDRRGTYVAFSAAGSVDDLNLCAEVLSPYKPHSH